MNKNFSFFLISISIYWSINNFQIILIHTPQIIVWIKLEKKIRANFVAALK